MGWGWKWVEKSPKKKNQLGAIKVMRNEVMKAWAWVVKEWKKVLKKESATGRNIPGHSHIQGVGKGVGKNQRWPRRLQVSISSSALTRMWDVSILLVSPTIIRWNCMVAPITKCVVSEEIMLLWFSIHPVPGLRLLLHATPRVWSN